MRSFCDMSELKSVIAFDDYHIETIILYEMMLPCVHTCIGTGIVFFTDFFPLLIGSSSH